MTSEYREKVINTPRLKSVRVVNFAPPSGCLNPRNCYLYEDRALTQATDILYGNYEGWMEIDPVHGSIQCGQCCQDQNSNCTLRTKLEVKKKTLSFPK